MKEKLLTQHKHGQQFELNRQKYGDFLDKVILHCESVHISWRICEVWHKFVYLPNKSIKGGRLQSRTYLNPRTFLMVPG